MCCRRGGGLGGGKEWWGWGRGKGWRDGDEGRGWRDGDEGRSLRTLNGEGGGVGMARAAQEMRGVVEGMGREEAESESRAPKGL